MNEIQGMIFSCLSATFIIKNNVTVVSGLDSEARQAPSAVAGSPCSRGWGGAAAAAASARYQPIFLGSSGAAEAVAGDGGGRCRCPIPANVLPGAAARWGSGGAAAVAGVAGRRTATATVAGGCVGSEESHPPYPSPPRCP